MCQRAKPPSSWLAVTQQHRALKDLLSSLGARSEARQRAHDRRAAPGKLLGRNMIVRSALAELSNTQPPQQCSS